MKNSKLIKTVSIILVLLLFLMQFAFVWNYFSGGWCSPYLGAPREEGHPAFQFSNYGFPVMFLTVTKEDCYSAQSTSYEWNPIGFIIDSALLILLAFPFWRSRFRKNSAEQ